eukprot:m.415721 g.415721  ORF g.415721 m.415721 type:complete len:985 (+) comp56605_c0_seq1:119-3073(+)
MHPLVQLHATHESSLAHEQHGKGKSKGGSVWRPGGETAAPVTPAPAAPPAATPAAPAPASAPANAAEQSRALPQRAPRNKPAVKASVAGVAVPTDVIFSPVPRATSLESSSSSSLETCLICSDHSALFCVGKCNHVMCFKCSARLRVLCKDNACPVCRAELLQVVIVESSITSFESFSLVAMRQREPFGIFFSSPTAEYQFNHLFDNRCQHCPTVFPSMDELMTHTRRQHHLQYCSLCVEHVSLFPSEHKLFTREQLSQHNSTAVSNVKGESPGHPLCLFCSIRIFDNDRLHYHMRSVHELCTVCAQAGKPNQFFIDAQKLYEHYEEKHFICDDEACVGQRHVVFHNEIDLKKHIAEVHLKNASRSMAKQARTIGIDLQFEGREHSQSGRGRGRREPARRDETEEVAQQAAAIEEAQRQRRQELLQHAQMSLNSLRFEAQYPPLAAAAPPVVAAASTTTAPASSGSHANEPAAPRTLSKVMGVLSLDDFPALMPSAAPPQVQWMLPKNEKQSSKQKKAAKALPPPPALNFASHVNRDPPLVQEAPIAEPRPVVRPVSVVHQPVPNMEDFPSLPAKPVPNVPLGTATKKTSKATAPATISPAQPSAKIVAPSASYARADPLPTSLPDDFDTAFPGLPTKPKSAKAKPSANAKPSVAAAPSEPATKKAVPELLRAPVPDSRGSTVAPPNAEDFPSLGAGSSAPKAQPESAIPLFRSSFGEAATLPAPTQAPAVTSTPPAPAISAEDFPALSAPKPKPAVPTSTQPTSGPTKGAPPGLSAAPLRVDTRSSATVHLNTDDFPVLGSPAAAVSSTKAPPPGFLAATRPRSIEDLVTDTLRNFKDQKYIAPQNLANRNRDLMAAIKALCDGDESLQAFKRASVALQNRLLAPTEYLAICSSCFGAQLASIFPEFIAQLPDISLQHALRLSYNHSLPELQGLDECPACHQLLLQADRTHHAQEHAILDFPALGSNGSKPSKPAPAASWRKK